MNLNELFGEPTPLTPKEVKAQTARKNRSKAYHRFKDIAKARRGLWALNNIPEDIKQHMGITTAQLHDLTKRFATATQSLSYTFAVCETCNQALRGRKLRTDNKRVYADRCRICNAKSDRCYSDGIKVRNIRHTTNLETAKAYVQTNHPEIFI